MNDSFRSYSYIFSRIHDRIGALVISHQATAEMVKKLYSAEWADPDLDRRENKQRMKSHAVAIWGYEDFLKEMTIIGLAKAMEDTFLDLKDEKNVDINIWAIPFIYEVRELVEARNIRNLNNVIKHSGVHPV